MKNIFEQLTDLLKKDERLASQDGVLLKNQTQELARKNDPTLIKLLLSDKSIKQHFFFEAEKTLIFDKEKFIRFISNKQFLPDSYTAFKNKIGFTVGDEYVSENKEVVLVWPYKDCILEGGMTKEDQKRDEIFYNETLAPDDITFLLDPKVFTNFKRIDKNGEHLLCHSREGGNPVFRRDEKGTIKDNLIIKGNNLLALASLKKEFAGKVKLIYIDPPYNTGNDGFKYNDSFNHSSWLTFMKNRLDIAKTLLRDDGVIFISIDDNEDAYLKILMYEIFGRENFVADFIWNHRKSSQNDIDVSLAHNYTITFAKNRNKFKLNSLAIDELKFSNPDNDPRGDWVADPFDAPNIRPNLTYPIINPNTEEEILPPEGRHWRMTKEKFKEALKDNRIIFGKTGKSKPQYKRFKFEAQEKGTNPFTIWDDVGTATEGTKELMKIMNGEKVFATPKPERLLQRIIHLATNEDDLVLDFFGGSGTTGAVAHKMNRQYVLIEQMDYIHDLPESRLKKVIAGEQGGISKDVNWKGGGDFVYMELTKWNERWMEKIRDAKTDKELIKIWNQLKENTFLSWRIDMKIFDTNAKDFADLSVADQKKFLIECLDKNQLFVNLSEIEDIEYEVSKEDKVLNRNFYSGK